MQGRYLRQLHQFSFRMMSSSSSSQVRSTTASGSQVYESQRAVHEYMLFHYGKETDHMPFETGPKDALNFPVRCANVCADNCTISNEGRALDIGCAVGGASFQLARSFRDVVGIDFSGHFIEAANTIKSNGYFEFNILERGNVFKKCSTDLDQSIDRSRVTFKTGDACNLSPELGKFDVILASNILCRLPSPRKFLESAPTFLNPGGCLVLVSPYSWLEEYTDVSEWIGGTKEFPDSADVICKLMKASPESMKLVHRENMPFLIREHERKFQYGMSDCMVFKKSI